MCEGGGVVPTMDGVGLSGVVVAGTHDFQLPKGIEMCCCETHFLSCCETHLKLL